MPKRKTKTAPGLKLDDGKLNFALVDADAEAEMVAVLTHGAVKYEPGNWLLVPDAEDRYFASTRRHLRLSRKGVAIDPETAMLHLAGAMCGVHFLLAKALRENPGLRKSFDARFAKSLAIARALRAKRLAAEKSR